MAIGAITVDDCGSPTAPAALKLTLPAHDAYHVTDHGPLDLVNLPTIRGVMFGNGQDQLRHVVTNVLKTGILAPEDEPTVAPSGVKAIYTFTGAPGPLDSSIAPGDRLFYTVSPPTSEGNVVNVYFWPTLVGLSPTFSAYILKGANDAATAENLTKFINQSGTEGVEYQNARNPVTGALLTTLLPDGFWSASRAGTTVTITYKRAGTLGNANTWEGVASGGGAVTTFGISCTTAGTDGVGAYPEEGSYRYSYGYVRGEDHAFSGLSPRATVVIDAGMQIALSAMAAPDDPDNDIGFIRVYRTMSGGNTEYRVVDQDEDDSTYTDSMSNDVLALRTIFDDSLYRSYAAGYPPRGRCLARYKGMIFTAGARMSADYAHGTSAVTNGNNEVTLTGGYPTVKWIGREFERAGDALRYSIVRVDAASRKIYLHTDYQGGTDGAAVYVVKDTQNPYLIHYSKAILPNAWPSMRSIKGVSSEGIEGVTALVPGFGALLAFTQTGLWRITGDDGTLAIHEESDVAGCVGPRAAVMVEGMLWWLGQEGIFVWGGGEKPRNLAKPPFVQGEVAGIQGTIDRLNQRQLSGVVAAFDPTERIIRWIVPLDDDLTNRYAIVIDLNAGTFTVDEVEDVTAIASVTDASGVRHMLTGDAYGNIFETGVGDSDGAHGFECVQAITASDVRSMTVAGTPFPIADDGLKGAPVYHISAAGAFERGKIASNTTSKLTFVSHLADAPAVGTQIVVGAIFYDAETGRYHGGDLRDEKGVPTITVGYTPQARGQMWVAAASDQGTPTVNTASEIALSNTRGRAVVTPREHGHYHKQRFIALAPNCTPRIHAIEVEMNFRDRGDDEG